VSRSRARVDLVGALSRTRGVTAERELRRLLADELGVEVVRNLGQARDGGADLLGVPGYAVECKRCRSWPGARDLTRWWQQATQQAYRLGLHPALAVREDRRTWRVLVALAVLRPDIPGATEVEHLVALTVPTFAAIARESIPVPDLGGHHADPS